MDAIECLKKRRSVRRFIEKDISKEVIEEIVESGALAATARNVQPIHFIVVQDKEKLNRLTEINDYGSFFKYCNAAIVVVSEDTKYYLEDGSAAIENMLLAARAHNIGSCWVAGDKKPYCRDIMDEFGVPEGYKLVG